MKKSLLILGSLLLATGAAITFTAKKKEDEQPVENGNDPELVNSGTVTPQKLKSILFVGDSNTVLPGNYADQFVKLYPTIRAKKIAKIGEKTDWMLAELKKELAINKYDVICVLGGSNDIYALNNIDGARKNLQDIYDLASLNNAKTIAIIPPNKNFYTKKTDEKQELLYSLCNWIENSARRDSTIDFWQITNDKKFFNSSDGYLHANEAAHKLLVNELVKNLVENGWLSVPVKNQEAAVKSPSKLPGNKAVKNSPIITAGPKPTIKDLTSKEQITKRRGLLISWAKTSKVWSKDAINKAVIAFGSKMSDYEVNASYIYVFNNLIPNKKLDPKKDAWLVTELKVIATKYKIFS